MKDTLLILLLQALVTEGCQFDSSLDGSTWWRGYEPVPSSPDHTNPADTPAQHRPAYLYDVFSRGNVKTFRSSDDNHPVDQWECVEMRREVIGTTTYYFCVLVHPTSRTFQCRQYTPVPPSVMLLRQHTYGVGRPGVDVCVELLRRVELVNVLIVYVGDLVAGARCPWPSGNYSMTAHFQDGSSGAPRGCTGEATVTGARLSNHGCGDIDTFTHPFNSKLFCVASWPGEALQTRPAVSESYSLLYRYHLHSSKYHFYVARYTMDAAGHVKMSLKSSPEDQVTYSLHFPLGSVNLRHTYLVLTRMDAAQRPVPPTAPLTAPPPGSTPGGRTPRYPVTSPDYMTTRRTVQQHVPCHMMPCLNGGKCQPDDTSCFCPTGTMGFRCEKVTETGMGTKAVFPPSGRRPTAGGHVSQSPQTPPAAAGSGRALTPPAPTQTSQGGGLSAAVAEDGSPHQAYTLLVCLVSLSVGFSLLSALLCVLACCRPPPPLLLDDRRQLLEAEAAYVPATTQVAPPYGAPTGQAWFPEYRRGGATLGAGVSVEKEYLPEEKKSTEKLTHLAGK